MSDLKKKFDAGNILVQAPSVEDHGALAPTLTWAGHKITGDFESIKAVIEVMNGNDESDQIRIDMGKLITAHEIQYAAVLAKLTFTREQYDLSDMQVTSLLGENAALRQKVKALKAKIPFKPEMGMICLLRNGWVIGPLGQGKSPNGFSCCIKVEGRYFHWNADGVYQIGSSMCHALGALDIVDEVGGVL